MSPDRWIEVDPYIDDLFTLSDPVLEADLRASTEAGLPPIQVTPNQGKLLAILAQSFRARSILEIGLLGGYSTIWLGRALAVEGEFLLFFGYWYIARYTHWEAGQVHIFVIFALIAVFGALILVRGFFWDRWKKKKGGILTRDERG